MQLATLRRGAETTAAARMDGEWSRLPFADLDQLLASGRLDAPERVSGELRDWQLMRPIRRPRKVICCGLNYTDHILEMERGLPTYPTLFAKFADTLTDPGADITVPLGVHLDWEAELAVVVGRQIRDADQAQARAAIAGYTVANDVSVRDWQRRTSQWFQGKAWDATTPIGPVIVTPDEVDPADGLTVTCRVNGEVMQHGSTAGLVFDAATLLGYTSTFTVLRPGDLVLSGTPGGVGAGRQPPRFLADGDVLETDIAGIGLLRNTIRFTAKETA